MWPRVQRTDKEITTKVLDTDETLVVTTATERDSTDLANVKLRQSDYSAHATGGRGGVDDLINLTHLHEPAILDVLVRAHSASRRGCHFEDCPHLVPIPSPRVDRAHRHPPPLQARRYANDCIYTFTGPILLAVNPFQRLPLYTKTVRRSSSRRRRRRKTRTQHRCASRPFPLPLCRRWRSTTRMAC